MFKTEHVGPTVCWFRNPGNTGVFCLHPFGGSPDLFHIARCGWLEDVFPIEIVLKKPFLGDEFFSFRGGYQPKWSYGAPISTVITSSLPISFLQFIRVSSLHSIYNLCLDPAFNFYYPSSYRIHGTGIFTYIYHK